jgi:hypothetical protein
MTLMHITSMPAPLMRTLIANYRTELTANASMGARDLEGHRWWFATP